MKKCNIGNECLVGFIKTCIWRCIATLITFLIMFAFGLTFDKSIYLSITDTSIKFIVFFIFDRTWYCLFDKNKDFTKNICIREKMTDNTPQPDNNQIEDGIESIEENNNKNIVEDNE